MMFRFLFLCWGEETLSDAPYKFLFVPTVPEANRIPETLHVVNAARPGRGPEAAGARAEGRVTRREPCPRVVRLASCPRIVRVHAGWCRPAGTGVGRLPSPTSALRCARVVCDRSRSLLPSSMEGALANFLKVSLSPNDFGARPLSTGMSSDTKPVQKPSVKANIRRAVNQPDDRRNRISLPGLPVGLP